MEISDLANGMEIILANGLEFDFLDGYMIEKKTKLKIKIDEVYDDDLLVKKDNAYNYGVDFDIIKVKFSIDCDHNNCEFFRTENLEEYLKNRNNC